MNFAQSGNLIEAATWIGIAITLLVKSRAAASKARSLQVLAASFAVFGVTDLIEIQTGAWWRPTGLLAAKAACVVIFAGCLWRHVRSRNRSLSDA